jgi:hypothetical protein
VGKVPSAQFAGKEMCTGPYNEPHKKVRTRTVRFQEVAVSKAEDGDGSGRAS